MNSTIGTAMGGGFCAGRLRIGGQAYALVVAPKAEGRLEEVRFNQNLNMVQCATSLFDGLANTEVMAEAGSELAQWARGLRIGGFDDWYIPAQDELEIIYRNLKPTSDENKLYYPGGVNLSAIDPSPRYTASCPTQTSAELFKQGGREAFSPHWFWTSTQLIEYETLVYIQSFLHGGQTSTIKSTLRSITAVRREPIYLEAHA